MNSSLLFQQTNVSFMQLVKTTCWIFASHWRPLMSIAFFHSISAVASVIILGLISQIVVAPYIEAIMEFVGNLSGLFGGIEYGRHLLDYSVGFGGTFRFLQNGYYYDIPDINFSVFELFDGKFIAIFVFIFILWAVVLEVVNSIFTGAFSHAIADIYAGYTPFASKSISFGWGKVCNVYIFRFLRASIVGILLLVTVIIPIVINAPDFENTWMITLGALIFICAIITICATMVAVVPSIVVERKSVGQAIERSWKLCRNFFCLVFCSQVGFFIGKFALSLLLNVLPGFLNVIGRLIFGLLFESLTFIFIFVIYITLRIKTENITQEDISFDIGNSDVVAVHGVEMSSNLKDNKGSYSNVVQAETV